MILNTIVIIGLLGIIGNILYHMVQTDEHIMDEEYMKNYNERKG